jgi:hypothetical protein
MSMLEKMAQAMELAFRESAAVDYSEPYVDEGDRGLILDGCFDLKVVARAALQAIREADDETAWALATASRTMNKNRAAQDWAAMIDAILAEGEA